MMSIESNTREAVAFLRNWNSSGPWVLTAVNPESRKVAGQTFTNLEDVASWVEARQGQDNIYFMVNPALRELKYKAKKEDVKELAWLHIDIDPRPGEDLTRERTRALAALNHFEPKPTVIVDSGGGYQAFWKLINPLPINGDIDLARQAEAYNQQLETLLQGDQCHNVDRIMRLPGTINMPDERKRKKGRVPALAQVVQANWECVYDISAFTPAAAIQPSSQEEQGDTTVTLSGNLSPVNLDDLPETVSQHIKTVIIQGDDAAGQAKYESRSEALFAVCCALVRAGCADDVIGAIILDPNYAVSQSVLEKHRPNQYAARQITRAKEYVIEPELMRLNSRYAVVKNEGGKCVVVEFAFEPKLNRTTLTRMSFNHFANAHRNKKIWVGDTKNGREVPLGKWWLDHLLRREYDSITFAPGKDYKGILNLWQGFTVEALPGEKHRSFLKHLKDNICGGNEEHYGYLYNWMARAVQQPGEPGEVALVLRGERGTGKSFFAKQFGKLFGQHFLQLSNAQHLVGNFNSHLRDCVLLFGDEAFYAGDRKHESVLKTLITEDTLMVEPKGVDVMVGANCIHLIMASNHSWVVPVGDHERRFLLLDVSNASRQDNAYFSAIDADLAGGGLSNLLYDLQRADLEKWNHRKVPMTKALQEQRRFNTSTVEAWLLDVLEAGVTPGERADKGPNPARADLQVAAMQLGMKTAQRLKMELARLGVLESLSPVQYNGKRVYEFKRLPILRKHFAYLATMEWDMHEEWKYGDERDEPTPF
jgi:hypothetical protein